MIIGYKSKAYPLNLKDLTPPPAIYIKGSVYPKDSHAIAVVGSRNPSPLASQICELFVKEFVKAKITIVSGLARGIDTIAHQTAIQNSGRTIAVLGNGFDVVYPKENKNLYLEIPKAGAIVSEFAPQTPPFPQNFLARNRLISGLSKAVLVVEAARRSGTLSTAAHAARQGREVFALPFGDGAKYLILNGATAVEDPSLIVKYLLNYKN